MTVKQFVAKPKKVWKYPKTRAACLKSCAHCGYLIQNACHRCMMCDTITEAGKKANERELKAIDERWNRGFDAEL